MTIEEKLKDLILNRYKSVLEFSNTADIPYTTVKSILSRGVGNASVNNIVKICKTLNISVDALADGKIQDKYYIEDKKSVELDDIVNRAKSSISNHSLTINGKVVDIEVAEPIIEALDIGYEMVKRKNAKEKL